MITEEERGDRERKCFILSKHTLALYKISLQIRNTLLIKGQRLKLLFNINKWETKKKWCINNPFTKYNAVAYNSRRQDLAAQKVSFNPRFLSVPSASSIYSSRSSISLRNWHQQKKSESEEDLSSVRTANFKDFCDTQVLSKTFTMNFKNMSGKRAGHFSYLDTD